MTTNAAPRVLTLDREPHEGIPGKWPGQIDVIRACLTHPFVWLTSGRGWGKSPIGFYVLLAEAGAPYMAGQVYEYGYCTPFNAGAADAYFIHKRIFMQAGLLDSSRGLDRGYSDTKHELHIKPIGLSKGTTANYWGLEEYDNIRRYRRHRLFLDECKDIASEAYYDVLLPMTFGRSGRVCGVGSPKRFGKGVEWFRREWRRGQDPEKNPGYVSFAGPSWANPFLLAQDLENYRRACHDPLTEREELGGEWVVGAGAVFGNLDAVFTVPVLKTYRADATGAFLPSSDRPNLWIGEEPDRGDALRQPDDYTGALDLARAPEGDSTILSLFNRRTRRQAALLRIHGILYTDQLPHIASLIERYGGSRCHIRYDATGGHGSSVTEALGRLYGESCAPRVWTHKTKGEDIAAAQMLCAQAGRNDLDAGLDWYLLDVPWQRAEFEEYQAEFTTRDKKPLPQPRYGAPAGLHDDAVSAACMAAPLVNRPYASTPRVVVPTRESAAWWDLVASQGEVVEG